MSPIVENGAPFWEGLAVADKPVSHIAFISSSRVDHLYFISTFYQLQMNITVKILLFLHPFCKPATAESDGITFCFLQHSHVSEFYFLFHFFAGFGQKKQFLFGVAGDNSRLFLMLDSDNSSFSSPHTSLPSNPPTITCFCKVIERMVIVTFPSQPSINILY